MSGYKDAAGRLLPAIIAVSFFSGVLAAQSAPSGSPLPSAASVIERAAIPPTIHRNRELVLWMISPQKHDRGPFSDLNPYTCPESTSGSYYEGPTRLSLLAADTGAVINTITIVSILSNGKDYFDVPYRIISGKYYLVPGRPNGTEGKPALLELRDLNGDGLALETAFFEALACMGLPTTLVGYSPAHDKVIQYLAELEITDFKLQLREGKIERGERMGKPTVEKMSWVDYLFARKPIMPGHWKYEIDYTGRGGTLDSYDVRYDQGREMFVGTMSRMCPSWNPSVCGSR